MNRDGSPETEMEAWLLEMGLGFAYAATSGADLTKSQAEVLSDSTPDPMHNPGHDWLLKEYVSHTDELEALLE